MGGTDLQDSGCGLDDHKKTIRGKIKTKAREARQRGKLTPCSRLETGVPNRCVHGGQGMSYNQKAKPQLSCERELPRQWGLAWLHVRVNLLKAYLYTKHSHSQCSRPQGAQSGRRRWTLRISDLSNARKPLWVPGNTNGSGGGGEEGPRGRLPPGWSYGSWEVQPRLGQRQDSTECDQRPFCCL